MTDVSLPEIQLEFTTYKFCDTERTARRSAFILETRPRNEAGNEVGCMGFSLVREAAKRTSCHLASFSDPAQLSGGGTPAW